ncbi:MAG: ABC transporter ATP-binding protein [Clostridia bacterium]|nr:ABC transporter ATP-binding protein [Clostridia bacterium]
MTSFRKIFVYLKPYTGLVIASIILMIVEVGSNVLQPKYMEQIVDNGILPMQIDTVVHDGLLMLAVALIGGIGGFISCICSNIYSQRFGNDVRKALYQKVMSLSAEQKDVVSPGSLITRMTGDTKVITEFSAVVITTVVKPLMLLVLGVVMVMSLAPFYGIVLLVSIPLQIALMVFFIRRSSVFFRVIQKLVDKLNSTAIHIVANNRLIKAYVTEDYEASRFDRQNIDLTGTVMKVQLFMAILNPLVMFILNAVVVAIIFIGGFQVEAGLIKIGSIMAVISYSQQILMSMMTMGGIFQYISRAKVSAERIAEIMETEPCVASGADSMETEAQTLEVCQVTFRYPRSKDSLYPALDNVSLKLRRAECIGILGPTGAGKSTLANLMIRAYDPDKGEVRINDKNIKDYRLPELRSKVLLVFQNSDLFPATLRENIEAGCACTQEAFEKAVRAAHADEIARHLEAGYDTAVAERGATLSGGQKQRVALARALLRQPSVLILDDSTSSLDMTTERAVLEDIRRAYKDMTLIVISQRVSCVQDADRILLMHNGTVDAEGSHAQLLDTSEAYRAICASQDPEGGDALA